MDAVLYTSAALCVLILLMLSVSDRGGKAASRRKNRVSYYADIEKAWHRQRWGMKTYNGRHNLGFGYFLHRQAD